MNFTLQISCPSGKVCLCLFFTIFSILFCPEKNYAQECNFEVQAGPDIEVCETGSVGLGGTIGGNATNAVWRGGVGTFKPNRNALDAEYIPDESEAGTTLVLILVASNPALKDCPPNRAEVKITVNKQPIVNAGDDQHVCAEENVVLNPSLSGKAKKTTWISTGKGSFDNPNKLDAVYTPSPDEIKKRVCYLQLIAEPYGVCLPDSDEMVVMIDLIPVVEIISEVKTNGTKPVHLSAKISGAGGSLKWSTSGNGTFSSASKEDTDYTPSADDLKNESILIKSTVTSPDGKCSVTKEILLRNSLPLKQN